MNFCSARGYVEILTYDDGEPVLEKNGDVVFYIDQEFDDFDDDDDWEYNTFNNEEMI
jgi:hypothetical protein